ncbi:ROK family protein [Chryseolinea sp. T2]|uniref:ROK family protein n=1 Tax=Chryseolinea sp. T2 TaxID=3129255 RepID=UPI0030783AE3
MRIGVDLGGTNVRASLVDDNGNIYEHRKERFNNNASLDDTLSQLISFIRPLMNSTVRGIGIGVPSVVEPVRGIVYNVTNIPSWTIVPLAAKLQQAFDTQVAVNNDVNCFALGEYHYGVLSGYSHAVGMSCGTGLGTGVIANGKLLTGARCGAGEVGLMHYLDKNIEYYASGNLFRVQFGVSAEEANRRASEGDPQMLEAWAVFGRHMAEAIKTVMYAYDPEAISIGGSLAKAFSLFERPMHEALLTRFEFPESIRQVRIMQSTNENISVIGAASLIP